MSCFMFLIRNLKSITTNPQSRIIYSITQSIKGSKYPTNRIPSVLTSSHCTNGTFRPSPGNPAHVTKPGRPVCRVFRHGDKVICPAPPSNPAALRVVLLQCTQHTPSRTSPPPEPRPVSGVGGGGVSEIETMSAV